MKKRFFVLSVVLLLVVSVLAGPAGAVSANGQGIQPYYVNLAKLLPDIDISGGTATCECTARSNTSSDSIYLSMSLQRYSNGSWTNVKSWATTGGGSASLYKTTDVSSGYYYRVKASATVYSADGTLVETANKTTSSKYY